MTSEIRPVTAEELAQAHYLIAYSFTADRSEEGRLPHVEGRGKAFALHEDGQMAAFLRVYPLRVFFHGVSVPVGGVSSVACLPEHRRKGYVGQLLRHALEVMREDGQPLSTLYTPHPSLYRRYGWMHATASLECRFNPKEVSFFHPAQPRGSAYRASEEDWPTLAEVYRRFAEPRVGYLDRDEGWWKDAVFRDLYDHKRKLLDVAVWNDGSGEARGYMVYQTGSDHRLDGPPATRFVIKELVAVDGDAYVGLLRYALAHDLAGEVVWWAPPDNPLPLALAEPGLVKTQAHMDFMLRVVDMEGALAARPAASGAPEGAFTVQIADAAAPWNQGVWRIESEGGRLGASKADGGADLSTDAATFAAMYDGFLKASDAVRAGLAEAGERDVASLADGILAADYPPYSFGFF